MIRDRISHLLILGLCTACAGSPAHRQSVEALGGVRFEEVGVRAGVAHSGPSFGASWGFFNQDSYPDLWVSHHQYKPSLFLNRGDGTFTDIIDLVWRGGPRKDTHGSSWGDFDGDGDQDLLETSGGLRGFMDGPDPRFGNNLYVNEGGHLVEQAQELGVAFSTTRGRHALWLDLNSDGLQDATLSNVDAGDRSFVVVRQTKAGFEDVTAELGMTVDRISIFASLADVTGDQQLDLLVHAPAYPSAVFDLSGALPRNVLPTLALPVTRKVKDVVLADFDGDLRTDLYLVRFNLRASQWIQRAPERLQVHLFEDEGEEVGISFESSGEIRLRLEPAWKYGVTTEKIFIGRDGWHPEDISFSLSAEDERVHGVAPHRPGEDMGVYVSFDPASGRWRLLHSKTSRDDLEKITGHVEADTPITAVEPINFDPGGSETTDRLLLQGEKGFRDAVDEAGLGESNACHTGVAADFDNDMDQDLYLVCTGVIANSPNRLFENLGGGRFAEVKGGAGAAGTGTGVGDSVAAADYDNDGFVDLFVTNGFGPTPFNDGVQELFHNTGNANHWIQIRLVGSISNRDGVGARVVITTPDGTRQLREQGGGVHWKSQNDQRLHFGLGSNRRVDRIEIRWPSGLEQELVDVPVDQVLEITEGESR